MNQVFRHQGPPGSTPRGIRNYCFFIGSLCLLEACSSGQGRPRYQAGTNQTKTEANTPLSGSEDGDLDTEEAGDDTTSMPPSPAQPPPTPTPPPAGAVPATGSVTISLNILPPTPAGPYRNRGHIRAAWVTDSNDVFLRTLHAFAGQRALHLKRWFSFTGNAIDGASGPTQTTPASIPLNFNWDLKSKAGTAMYTGTYKLWLEYTEANTPALDAGKKPLEPNQGIDAVNGYEAFIVPFTVGTAASTKMEVTSPVFKDIAIKHAP